MSAASQSSLFDDEPPAPVETLFFALLPPPDAVQALTQAALALRARHRLPEPAMEPGRLHLSLHGLGEYAGLPPDLEARAREAAALVDAPPAEVRLDEAMSFGNPRERHPVVLAARTPSATLAQLHRQLGLALARVGLGRQAARALSPHVSLIYVQRVLAPEPAPAAVEWTAAEFVLVHSLVGQHRHTHLARWPLRG